MATLANAGSDVTLLQELSRTHSDVPLPPGWVDKAAGELHILVNGHKWSVNDTTVASQWHHKVA